MRSSRARSANRAARWLRFFGLLAAIFGCDSRGSSEEAEPNTSPELLAGANPKVVPAPRTADESALGKFDLTDGTEEGAIPTSTVPTKPEPLEPQRPTPALELLPLRVLGTLDLDAHFRWPGVSTEPVFPGLEPEAAKIASQRTSWRMKIELETSGHMRLQIVGGAFPLPSGSELLSRFDRYGHWLVWPDRKTYRVLTPGTLPALLRERRADEAPLVATESKGLESLRERRFGFPLQRARLKTPRGALTVEIARVEDAGQAGKPLCRFLLELLGAAPYPALCADQHVPVKALFELDGAKLEFVVSSLRQRTEASYPLEIPPPRAEFTPRGLPQLQPVFLEVNELGALRRGEEATTLTLTNDAEVGAYLVLGGVPVAFLPPRSQHTVLGLVPGDYAVSFRDFFGRPLRPPENVNLDEQRELKLEGPEPERVEPAEVPPAPNE